MDIGPSIRRFFINTLFDSTFTLLGVIVGSAFVAKPEIEVILGTMITISLGLGISSGASVYQAESLEREREVHELEKAMLTSLKDTKISDSARNITIIVSAVNLSTPFLVCGLYIWPLAVAHAGIIGIKIAACISIAIALSTLMVTGVIVGRKGKENAILKGIKMATLGGVTFIIGYLINLLL
jgi:predicted membrane protein (TIGR00267 family)